MQAAGVGPVASWAGWRGYAGMWVGGLMVLCCMGPVASWVGMGGMGGSQTPAARVRCYCILWALRHDSATLLLLPPAHLHAKKVHELDVPGVPQQNAAEKAGLGSPPAPAPAGKSELAAASARALVVY